MRIHRRRKATLHSIFDTQGGIGDDLTVTTQDTIHIYLLIHVYTATTQDQ